MAGVDRLIIFLCRSALARPGRGRIRQSSEPTMTFPWYSHPLAIRIKPNVVVLWPFYPAPQTLIGVRSIRRPPPLSYIYIYYTITPQSYILYSKTQWCLWDTCGLSWTFFLGMRKSAVFFLFVVKFRCGTSFFSPNYFFICSAPTR